MPSPRRTWVDEPADKKCTRCNMVKPVEEFAYASAGRRKPRCKVCEAAERRKQYLSAELRAELGQILRFVATDDDSCVGEECPHCTNAIAPGDDVVARAARFEHGSCLTGLGLLEDPAS